jgi:PrcB C-terminal
MRIPTALLVVSLFAFLHSARAQGPSKVPEDSVQLPMQQVFTAQYTGIDQSRRLVIRTPQEWQAIWSELRHDQYPIPAPPAVDFNQFMAILAAIGTRSTGGHAIRIEGVSRSGGRLFVVVQEISPGAGCITTQALTSPVDAVQVPQSDEPVIFVERQESRNCD